jgi:hypothetical protein
MEVRRIAVQGQPMLKDYLNQQARHGWPSLWPSAGAQVGGW